MAAARRPPLAQGGDALSDSADVSALLSEARRGNEDAVAALFPVLYKELRRSARAVLRGWSPGNTMNSAALVNEAYLKLVGKSRVSPADRNHFMAIAANAMRQIMVDHARRRTAKKRGAGATPVEFDEAHAEVDQKIDELLSLDLALEGLAQRSGRLAQLVELRFFAGLTSEEAADVMGTSQRTAMRDWRKARAFLSQAMQGSALP